MDNKLYEYFFEEGIKAFDFMSDVRLFATPERVLDERTGIAKLIFKGSNVAIQCILDQRDEDVDCKIARVIDGHITSHFARDERGLLVRESLYNWVVRRGGSPAFTKIGGRSFKERIPIILKEIARMLQNYGQEILADSPGVFKESIPK